MKRKKINNFDCSICIRRLDINELREILEKNYCINSFMDNEDSSVSQNKKVKQAYNMALETLQDNGYVLPSGQFMIKGKKMSEIKNAYMHDIFVLAYMYKRVRNDKIKAEDMPISSSTRGIYVQRMEETAFSEILGVRRASEKPYLWQCGEKKGKKIVMPYIEHRRVPMNTVLYQFYAGLLATTTKNPFIDIAGNPMIIRNQNITEQTLEENLMKPIEERDELLQDTFFLNDKYREEMLTLFEATPGSVDLFRRQREFDNKNISLEKVTTFYNIFWKRMKKIYKDEGGRMNQTEYDDQALKLCHKYLLESLLASSYYNEISKCSYGIKNVLYFASEDICCVTRMAHGGLYMDAIDHDYYYKNHLNKSKSDSTWERQVYSHMRYTTKHFLPALYYLFIYYLEIQKLLDEKRENHELREYLLSNEQEIEKYLFNHNKGFQKENTFNIEQYYTARKKFFLGYAKGGRRVWF